MISARRISANLPWGALHEVSLDLRRGECVGLAGPAGSGKRTLLHVLAGFAVPQAGSVHLAGDSKPCDVAGLRQAVMYVDNHHVVGRGLRVDEYLGFVAHARRMGEHASLSDAISSLDLHPAAAVDALRHDQRVALSFACAMVTGSEIILIAPGLDTIAPSHREIARWITAAAQRNVALMVATNDPALHRAACDRVITLEQGRIVGGVLAATEGA